MGLIDTQAKVLSLTKQITELEGKDPKDKKIAQLKAKKAELEAQIQKELGTVNKG